MPVSQTKSRSVAAQRRMRHHMIYRLVRRCCYTCPWTQVQLSRALQAFATGKVIERFASRRLLEDHC